MLRELRTNNFSLSDWHIYISTANEISSLGYRETPVNDCCIIWPLQRPIRSARRMCIMIMADPSVLRPISLLAHIPAQAICQHGQDASQLHRHNTDIWGETRPTCSLKISGKLISISGTFFATNKLQYKRNIWWLIFNCFCPIYTLYRTCSLCRTCTFYRTRSFRKNRSFWRSCSFSRTCKLLSI